MTCWAPGVLSIKDFDHLKIGQSGGGVHGKDKLCKEPEPEGRHPKTGQRAGGDGGNYDEDDVHNKN